MNLLINESYSPPHRGAFGDGGPFPWLKPRRAARMRRSNLGHRVCHAALRDVLRDGLFGTHSELTPARNGILAALPNPRTKSPVVTPPRALGSAGGITFRRWLQRDGVVSHR